MSTSKELEEFRNNWKVELQDKTKYEQDPMRSLATESEQKAYIGDYSGTGVEQNHLIRKKFKDILGGCGQEIICEFPEATATDTPKSLKKKVSIRSASEPKRRKVELSTSSSLQAERFLDMFLADLNEIEDIPFFDIDLPRELAINIFKHLSGIDLCRCAQVSKAWRSLAEDDLLWCKICHELGFDENVTSSEKQGWKEIVKSHNLKNKQVQYNWKNRTGSYRMLDHVQGGVLRAVTSHQHMLVAGYSSREVKLWNTELGESCILRPSETVRQLVVSEDEGPQRYSLSKLGVNQFVTAALYAKSYPSEAVIDIWSNASSTEAQCSIVETGNISHLHVTEQSNHVIITKGSAVLIHEISQAPCPQDDLTGEESAVLNVTKIEDTVISPDEKITHIAIIPRIPAASKITHHAIVAASGSRVKVHVPGANPEEMSTLHDVYLQNVQLMECTRDACILAIHDFNPGHNSNMYTLAVYCLQSARQLHKFSSGSSILSCVHKNPDIPDLIAAGTYNTGIKLFDTRCYGDVIRLRDNGHSSTRIQMDEWKLVSGSQQGYVSVWDYRMPVKCWDWHNRCPVQYVKFHNNTLITANIPQGDVDCDEDGMTNSRYRGSVHLYDFSQNQDSSFLPTICHSTYDMPDQYNYNINLAVPYDKL